jgi:hypothetical protein
MELGDAGVAGLQHLDIELGRDRLDLVRVQHADEAVHLLAPAPEIVARAGGGLGQPGHGALEGVAVQIGHAGQHDAGDRLGIAAHRPRRDTGNVAAGVDLDQDVIGPAIGQKGGLGEIARGHDDAFFPCSRSVRSDGAT